MYIQKDARAAIGECIKRTGTVNAVLIEMCVKVYLSFEANLYSVDKKNSEELTSNTRLTLMYGTVRYNFYTFSVSYTPSPQKYDMAHPF